MTKIEAASFVVEDPQAEDSPGPQHPLREGESRLKWKEKIPSPSQG